MSIEKNKTKQKLVELYIESLKKNELPWTRGWEKLAYQKNGASGRAYTGTNALLLSLISDIKGYSDTRWFTFNQIRDKKTEKGIDGEMFKGSASGAGVPIVYYGVYSTELKKMLSFDEYKKLINESKIDRNLCYFKPFRTYFVFNGDLVNPEILKEFPEEDRAVIDKTGWSDEKINELDTFISEVLANMKLSYKFGGNQAYYSPAEDAVHIPKFEHFKDPGFYYSTFLHEISHATGASTRLNREGITGKHGFGSIEYAKEELNAEIASSFICGELGLEPDPEHINNHIAYVQNWIQVLEKEPETLFKAISIAGDIEQYVLDQGLCRPDKEFADIEEER